MSTRSNIAVEHVHGSVSSIYCHSDGYLSGVGLTLFTHYPRTADAVKLAALGDLSYLGDCPGKGGTFAYRRDRKETNVNARKYSSAAEYLATTDDAFCQAWGYEYCYLLTRKNGWLVRIGDLPWEPLRTALITGALLNE